MKDLLRLDNIHSNIGQFQILQGVHLSIPERQVTVLLGRNGAGKTTTLRTILGYVRAHQGEIQLNDTSLLGLPTFQICRLGVSYLPEEGHVFVNLSIEENLRLADRRKDGKHGERTQQAMDMFPDLRTAWKRPAGTLSGGQKQMLAMACVLVAHQPLLLIDEPSKGLSPAYVAKLAEVLNLLKETTTILLVEQNFHLARQVAERFSILEAGRTVLEGSMAELIAQEDWQQQYLGIDVATGGAR
jgi:branched-chain amino acid transport system ATP-binding protein